MVVRLDPPAEGKADQQELPGQRRPMAGGAAQLGSGAVSPSAAQANCSNTTFSGSGMMREELVVGAAQLGRHTVHTQHSSPVLQPMFTRIMAWGDRGWLRRVA